MNRKQLFFILFIALIGFSCNQRETYYQFHQLKDNYWSKSDTLYFEIDSTLIDPNKEYDVSIESVNNNDYLYQNLWLYVFDDFKTDSYDKQEKQYLLADSVGRWIGNGYGQLFDLTLPYKIRVLFPEKRNYHLKIVHGMVDEPLYGIEKLGVRIIESKTN